MIVLRSSRPAAGKIEFSTKTARLRMLSIDIYQPITSAVDQFMNIFKGKDNPSGGYALFLEVTMKTSAVVVLVAAFTIAGPLIGQP